MSLYNNPTTQLSTQSMAALRNLNSGFEFTQASLNRNPNVGPVFGDGHAFSFGDSGGRDAMLRFDWSRLGGVVELASQEASVPWA